jgi:hypothetical protein
MGRKQQVTGEKLLALSLWLLARSAYAARTFLSFPDSADNIRIISSTCELTDAYCTLCTNPKSLAKRKWWDNSAPAICTYRAISPSDRLPQPSAKLAAMEADARRIWLVSPYPLFLGKEKSNLVDRQGKLMSLPRDQQIPVVSHHILNGPETQGLELKAKS